MNKSTEDYIKSICAVLKINLPEVIEDSERFNQKTMFAEADLKNNRIFLSDKVGFTDFDFAIAHELRHLWQAQDDFDKWFGNYVKSSETDIETYNLQPAEIDANAFATIVMVDVYHLKPRFDNLPKEIVDLIYERAEKISKNFS